MNKSMSNLSEFANDVHDLMGMNTQFITQRRFFDKWVENDNAFIIDEDDKERPTILFDDFTVTIESNHAKSKRLLDGDDWDTILDLIELEIENAKIDIKDISPEDMSVNNDKKEWVEEHERYIDYLESLHKKIRENYL